MDTLDEAKKLHHKIDKLDDNGIKRLSDFLDGYLYAKDLVSNMNNKESDNNHGNTH